MQSKQISQLKEKTVRSLSLLVIREFLMKGCALFGQFILVRILAPDIFGIFAILSFILSGAEMFTDLGLSLTLIQRKEEPTRDEISAVFSVKCLLTIFVFIVLYLIAPYFTFMYHNLSSEKLLLIRVLALTLLMKPLRTIYVALLERALRYRDIATIDISGMVSYYFVAVFLAVLGFGIKSFIGAILVKEIVELLIAFSFYRTIPGITFDFSKIKKMISVGKFFQMGTLLGFIDQSTIPIIAGVKTSAFNVGLLDWGSNIASVPLVLADNLGRVSFASFSKIQEDKILIARAIEEAFALLSVLTIGTIVITIIFGNTLVHYVLTDKWLPALPALYWFIGGTFFLNGTGVLGHAIMALGETKKLFIASVFLIAFELIVSYILLSRIGFVGIAVGSLLGSASMFFVFAKLCKKLGISVCMSEMLKAKGEIFICSLLGAFVIDTVLPVSFVTLLVKIFLFFVLYVGIYYLFARHDLTSYALLLKKTLVKNL